MASHLRHPRPGAHSTCLPACLPVDALDLCQVFADLHPALAVSASLAVDRSTDGSGFAVAARMGGEGSIYPYQNTGISYTTLELLAVSERDSWLACGWVGSW